MSLGDITIYKHATTIPGSKTHQVVSGGTPPAINAGEFVLKTLGNQYVIVFANNKPVVGTDYMAGLAVTTSTETASNDGTVDVIPLIHGTVYLIKPDVAATWNTQALYNALVGTRVLIKVSAGALTLLAADSSTSGCVVENLNITQYPGAVAISIRQTCSYMD